MAFIDIERKVGRYDPRPMITITKTGNINPNAAMTRAIQVLKMNFCRFQFDRDTLTLRMILLKQPGNDPNVFKIIQSGGNGRKTATVSARSVLQHSNVGYDFRLKKMYEATLIQKHNPPYIDIVLAPDRFRPSRDGQADSA